MSHLRRRTGPVKQCEQNRQEAQQPHHGIVHIVVKPSHVLGDALRLRVPLEPTEFHGDATLKQVGRVRPWVLEEDVDERPARKGGKECEG